MKKWHILVLCVALLLVFVSCEGSSENSDEFDEMEDFDLIEEDSDYTGEEDSIASDDWYSFINTYTDDDGYTFEIRYQFTPFMLLSDNEDKLRSAWNEIESDQELPEYDDWGLDDGCISTHPPFLNSLMNDMYYCLGTITVNNITEGWSLSSGNTKSVYVPELDWVAEELPTSSGYSDCLVKSYYSNMSDLDAVGLRPRPEMDDDDWGPVSFIFMVPENIAPNYPEGENLETLRKGSMRCVGNSEILQLDFIGKDGERYSPLDEE